MHLTEHMHRNQGINVKYVQHRCDFYLYLHVYASLFIICYYAQLGVYDVKKGIE